MRLARQDAFWEREILDRPVVNIVLPKPGAPPPPAYPPGAAVRERWLDAEYNAHCALARVMSFEYLGDALPNAWPNLGPELLSAYLGCEMEYTETTAWAKSCLDDWGEADKIAFSPDNFYWRKTLEMTEALLAAGRNKFYTAVTDLHPGGDALAGLREPQRLSIDLVERPEAVKVLLKRVTDIYLQLCDRLFAQLAAAGQPVGCNAFNIISTKRWNMVCNDFSFLISSAMFDDIFLPEIIRECRHWEASCYHLDGEGALRHLDSLLAVAEITAIQWVCGVSRGPASRWMDLYKKCQAAGKGLQIRITPEELDFFMTNLNPQGIWLAIERVETREEGEALIGKVAGWR